MQVRAIASAVVNHVYSGLQGTNSNMKLSVEQLEDECIGERNTLLKEMLIKGVISLEELYLSINCIEVDCDYMSKCCDLQVGEKALHFEIPPIMYINASGNTVKFVGSVDRKVKYKVYMDESYRYHQYKKRGGDTPYVYIDTAINSNGNMDCYIFNAPFVKYISITALFQDPRKLFEWDCCRDDEENYLEMGLLSETILNNLTQRYIYYYRQAVPVTNNNQQPK